MKVEVEFNWCVDGLARERTYVITVDTVDDAHAWAQKVIDIGLLANKDENLEYTILESQPEA